MVFDLGFLVWLVNWGLLVNNGVLFEIINGISRGEFFLFFDF